MTSEHTFATPQDLELNKHTFRLSMGYVAAMLVLAIIAVGSYYVLHRAQNKQANLSEIQTIGHALQQTIRTAADHSAELKLQAQKNNFEGRLYRLIRLELAKDAQKIAVLKAQLESLLQTEHGGTDLFSGGALQNGAHLDNLGPDQSRIDYSTIEHSRIARLYYAPPNRLLYRLDNYLLRLNSMLADSRKIMNSQLAAWLPIDAVVANRSVLLSGFAEASKVVQLENRRTRDKLANLHKFASITLLSVLALLSLLVFLPLMLGLEKVHAAMTAAQQALMKKAHFDVATDLPNTAGLLYELNKKRLATDGVLLIRVNNTVSLGSLLGSGSLDEFYRQFAYRIQQHVGLKATVVRCGDEEFAIHFARKPAALKAHSLDHFPENYALSADWMSLRRALSARYTIDNVQLYPDIVMGLSQRQPDEFLLHEHLSNARLAYLQDIGDSEVQAYRPSMKEKIEAESRLIDEMRIALKRREFVPFYQIKVDSQNKRPCGMEALCRWVKADGTVVSPAEFIPVAEKSGLIVEMTWQLLDVIAKDVKRWREWGVFPGHVAFNASTAVLRNPDFVPRLLTLCPANKDGSHPLEVEITENVAMSDGDWSIASIINELRSARIRVALDDFGTGVASLSTIVSLGLDVVKIDRSFVRDMHHSIANSSVVEAIINMCRVMNLECVAEGVETEAEAAALKAMKCTQLQGFHFYRPVNAASAGEHLMSALSRKSVA